jgi:hypothetical protein
VYGDLPAQVSIFAGSTAGFTIIQGGILITSPVFYAKVNDSITTTTNLGVLIPLYFQVASSVYALNPAYTPVKKNSSGIVLQTAPWTQQTAVISETDKTSIRTGLALEATVATKASQTSVSAIPTNPMLATDTRLNNLDATISTRLAASAYVAPVTPPTAAQNATATLAAMNANPPSVNLDSVKRNTDLIPALL